jgi:hypothetical protein
VLGPRKVNDGGARLEQARGHRRLHVAVAQVFQNGSAVVTYFRAAMCVVDSAA